MFCSQLENEHSPSLFDQTVRDTDEKFYATFPEARDALARSTTIFSDNTPIDDLNLVSFNQHDLYSCQSQEYSWTDPGFSPVNDTHTPAFFHHNISLPVPSYREIAEPRASSNYGFSYQQQYPYSDLTRPAITQSSFDPAPPSVPISFALHTSSSDLAGPSVTGFPERVISVDQIRSRDTPIVPILQGRKVRRALRLPTPELTNGCELSVMRLDGFSEPLSSPDSGTQISYFHSNQRRAHTISHLPSRALTWDSVMSSPRSIRLSPLPSKRQLEKKPPLACLFCRGRKIACGPPLPGSPKKTCNQCQRRSLRCEYPSESRRGMRKKKASAVLEATAADI